MEQVNLAQLTNALSVTGRPSAMQLSEEDGQELQLLIIQMADRYPSQDLADSMEGYLQDYEELALKYSLPRVKAALQTMRIKPGQSYFPRPDEVATQVEESLIVERLERERRIQARRRAEDIARFWRTAPEWMEFTGCTEEEMLNRFPSYRGTKP